MSKPKLQPFFFMVYRGLECDVEKVYARDFDDAVEIMKEVGTLMETHHTTSFPRILSHESRPS